MSNITMFNKCHNGKFETTEGLNATLQNIVVRWATRGPFTHMGSNIGYMFKTVSSSDLVKYLCFTKIWCVQISCVFEKINLEEWVLECRKGWLKHYGKNIDILPVGLSLRLKLLWFGIDQEEGTSSHAIFDGLSTQPNPFRCLKAPIGPILLTWINFNPSMEK